MPYQLLAMFLTYASIVSTYIPPIIQEITKTNPEAAAPATATGGPARERARRRHRGGGGGGARGSRPPAAAAPSLAGFAIAIAVLFALAFAAPFLMGLENIIGIVIIGIGLFEAWKINRKTRARGLGPVPDRRAPRPAAPAP